MDLFVTLDYELFLGRKTGTPENCLIKPMNELCAVADKIGFKYVVFVDAAYVLRLFQLKDQCIQLQEDYNIITKHIKSLVDKGHDIQLHFHPQWLYSSFDNISREWKLDLLHYKISDMEPNFALETFGAAKRLLDEIVGYTTCAFRAGGYCLDTEMGIQSLFKENKIKIDSSVARGLFENKSAHKFDYRTVPPSTIYRFNDDVKKEVANGDYIELSISSVKIRLFEYFRRVKKLQKTYKPSIVYKDGTSMNSLEKVSVISKILGLLKGKVYLASIDGISSTMLPLFFKKSSDNQYVLIGHPKNATDASISLLNDFLNKYKGVIVYKTTKDLLR